MLRTVSSEPVRVTCASARLSSGHASRTWSRKQWPTLSRIGCSAASSSGRIDFRPAHLWARGTTTWNGSSYRNSVTMPGGANGNATIAASMRPDFSEASSCSVRFSSRSSGICGAHSCKAGMRSGRRYGATVKMTPSFSVPASWLRPDCAISLICDASSSTALRLLDDARADRRHRDLALSPLEEPRAQLLLELLNGDRQRRLAHEAPRRGAAEAPLVRHGDDVAKLVQRHRCRCCARSRRKAAKSAASSGCFNP